MDIRRATAADIPFVMATERLPGYEAVVGRWDEATHRAALADPGHAYFVAVDADRPIGFVILRGWNAPEQVVLLKRIAVASPGCGAGRALLETVVDTIFAETDAHRLWLGVFPDNLRARHAYEAVGFRAEGVARGNAYFGGIHHDELIMAVLRTDRHPAPPNDRASP